MAKGMRLDILCCPECYSKLKITKDKLLCSQCHKTFLIRNGIPSFLHYTNHFYEGRFNHTIETERRFSNPVLKDVYTIYSLVAIDRSRERFLKKVLKAKTNLTILDLGCGGGRKSLTQFGTVIGVDISLQSLRSARKIYNMVVHADILKLPFPDGTFDIVCSLDVIGHIPLRSKNQLISEVYRVTKKGGYSVHSIECDSKSLFYRWAHNYLDLYKKYFIEMYGHYGLELPDQIFERFLQVGFIPVIERADPCKGYLRPIESYVVFFDNEYKEKSVWIKILVTICKPMAEMKTVRHLVNFILGLFIPLASLITPANHRDSIKVYYQKL